MNDIQRLFEQRDWGLTIEFDPNTGGDGARIQFTGNPHSFHTLAAFFTAMADLVDNPDHPASETGWHLSLNSEALPQLQFKNAAVWSVNCLPAELNEADHR